MLWYKAWRESRIRFLLGAALIVLLRWQFLADGWRDIAARQSVSYFDPTQPIPYSKLVWQGVWAGGGFIFVAFVILLGLGGLQRERATGTAAFTLALPATRLQLLTARAGVGFLQMIVLALIPAVLVPTLSPVYAQQAYPASQALQFALLYIGCGAVCFAGALLCSTLVASEHTAVAACIVTPVVYQVAVGQVWQITSSVTGDPLRDTVLRFRSLNLYDVMIANDMPFRDPETFLLTGLPWVMLLAEAAVAAGLVALAVRVAQRQDF